MGLPFVCWVLSSVFADRLACQSDAEFLEDLAVHFAGHDGGVHLAAVEHG